MVERYYPLTVCYY